MTTWDQIQFELKDLNLLAVGFLGIEKQCENAILPYKKPKGGQLQKCKNK